MGVANPDESPKAESPGNHLRGVAVVREVRRRGVVQQAELASDMGTPRQMISRAVGHLRDGGVLKKARGHKAPLMLDPRAGYLIGVDVAHGEANLAVSDLAYNVLGTRRKRIPIHEGKTALQEIAALIIELLDDDQVPDEVPGRLVGVGVALPGPIRREENPEPPPRKQAAKWDRWVDGGQILPGWERQKLEGDTPGAYLAKLLTGEEVLLSGKTRDIHAPRQGRRRMVWIENDASAGALGVYTYLKLNPERVPRLGKKADPPPDDVVYVRLTTGIGAGIINKGHLVNGARGFAGELGHALVDPGGAFCPLCGRRGCLETVASNRALVSQLSNVADSVPATDDESGEGDSGRNTSGWGSPAGASEATPSGCADTASSAWIQERLGALLEGGHPAVAHALWDAGWHVGAVIANVCCILNPSLIVFDGRVADHGDLLAKDNVRKRGPFLEAVNHAIERNTMSQVQAGTQGMPPTATWAQIYDNDHSPSDTDHSLTPELLGALALALDHLGDGYLLDPVRHWWASSTPSDAPRPVNFSVPDLPSR